MKPPPPYLEYLVETVQPLGEITWRSMFGGYALYADGTIFGLVGNGALFLKADEVNVEMFESRGLPPFQPWEDKAMSMKYYAAPPEIFEDPAEMLRWCGASVAAGKRGQKPKRVSRQNSSSKRVS